MDLESLSRIQLEQLRANPNIGAVLREKIDARLAAIGNSNPEDPTSTDPRDRMNQTERRMADVLDMRIRSGEVLEWLYEDVTFRVGADRCRYTPDFVARLQNSAVEIVEVKGNTFVTMRALSFLQP